MLDPAMPRPTPAAGELGVTLEQSGSGDALLMIAGEIDTLTADALERGCEQLLATRSGVLVIDLSNVTFLASSGLAVLIRAAHQAGERRLRLVTPTRTVRRPLEITGSDQLFDLYNDRGAAMARPD